MFSYLLLLLYIVNYIYIVFQQPFGKRLGQKFANDVGVNFMVITIIIL
jgi:hypothetical protein